MLREYPDAPALHRLLEFDVLDRLAEAARARQKAEAEPSASYAPGYKRNYVKIARRKELVRHLRLRGKPIRGEERMRPTHH